MINLKQTKIYKNDKDEYQLESSKEFSTEVQHDEVTKWAMLFSFVSEKHLKQLLESPSLSNKDITYTHTKEEIDGTITVLVVNKDAEGGIVDYVHWREDASLERV